MLVSICVQLQHLLAHLLVTIKDALLSVYKLSRLPYASVYPLTYINCFTVLQSVGIFADLYNTPSR
jgi:hypothetical protein